MKLLILIASLIVGCVPSRNLASAYVHGAIPDAKCESFYTDVGAHHTHSATCRLPAAVVGGEIVKVVVYCVLADDKGPACQPLNDQPRPAPASKPAAPNPGEGPGAVPRDPPPAPKGN